MKEDRKKNQDCEKLHLEKENNESISTSRRKALKTIAAGTAVAGTMALTGKWSKPVVDTIILPAHAQATNPEGPVTSTTTPAPTTTAGACSPLVEAACYTTVLDMVTEYVISATITGNVSPVQAGVDITVQINALVDGGTQRTDILHATTNAAGSFSATQTYTAADRIMNIGTPSATGPCNGVDVPRCVG
ncbi:MAG TPA: twin-arginine translocation signal domain-containing protein [Desulfobulbaceae bacterium]|nr:twin-arginine translocation signal domain-containing protein [Desulfobulbaceae bacterium]